jgi:peptidoglycan/LPS O-acetylase OafA/YrhL
VIHLTAPAPGIFRCASNSLVIVGTPTRLFMDEKPAVNSRKHLPALDAVRGVAILGVFCFHILSTVWGRDQLSWGHLLRQMPAQHNGFLWFYPFTFGWIGVSLFFVLSGFVIHYSTLTSAKPFSTLQFYSRRFWRIYPPYAMALVTFCILKVYAVTRLSIITHVLLLHDFSGQTFYVINPSLWSIATEVQFYLVYPLIVFARPRFGMLNVLWGVLGLSLAFRCLFWVVKMHDPAVFEDSHLMLWANPLITLFDWTLGAYLAEQFFAGRRVFPQGGTVLAGAAALFIVSTFIRPLSMFSFQFASLLSAICIERAIWSSAPPSLLKRALIPLGLCSYSFYLFHQPLLEIMVKWSQAHVTTNRFVLALGAAPVFFGILFALSWVIYLVVEKNSIRLGKRFAFESRSKTSAAPPGDGRPASQPPSLPAGEIGEVGIAGSA